MPYRVSFKYRVDSSKAGSFSENFWNSKGNVTDAATAAADLWPLLLACHGAQVWSPYFTVSNASGIRDTFTGVDENAAPRPIDAANPDADYPTTALQISLRRSGGSGVHVWMKGLQDLRITNAGRFVQGGVFRDQWALVKAELETEGKGWCIFVKDPTSEKKLVESVSLTGVVKVSAHGFDASNKVSIQRVKNITGINRNWRFSIVDTDHIQLLNFTALSTLPASIGEGVAQENIYLTSKIVEAKIVRSTSHKIGRPLQAFSGHQTSR